MWRRIWAYIYLRLILMAQDYAQKKPMVHHISRHRKQGAGRKAVESRPPATNSLTKIVPINPFASWNMPRHETRYLKPKDRDCL